MPIISEKDNAEARAAQIEKDKKDSTLINSMTDELIKSMEILKEVDRLH